MQTESVAEAIMLQAKSLPEGEPLFAHVPLMHGVQRKPSPAHANTAPAHHRRAAI